MPFVLDPNRPVDVEIRRVTRERLSEAVLLLDGLHDADASEIERAVHDVRKRCKEARATARLVRSALGDDFDRFNATVRSAAEELAPIRDAHAVLATFDDLRATIGRAGDARLDAVSDAQRTVADTATSGVRPTDPRIRRARKLLVAARKQVARWDIPDDHLVLVDGLDTSYRRVGAPFGESPTHRPIAGCTSGARRSSSCGTRSASSRRRHRASSNPSASTLDSLAEALGDDHDLSVLVDRLRKRPRSVRREAERQTGATSRPHATGRSPATCVSARRHGVRRAAPAFARRVRTYWELTAASGLEIATGGIAELAREERHTSHAGLSSSTVERERKYLLTEVPALSGSGTRLRQGYLAIDGSVSVRVRESGEAGCTLTVKAGRGAVRTELEWPLTDEQFDAAWDQTGGRRIHKTRHRVPLDEHTVEVDVFHDDLDGLVLAEVEFESDDALAAFEPPAWFGPEVTDDEGYTNASLAANAGHGPPRRP